MNIYQKGKSRYITSILDGKDYNLTTGHFKRHLDIMNVTLTEYFEKHEGVVRDKCQACREPAEFIGYHPNNTVKWHSVCGKVECAKVMYSRAHLSRTPENWAAASEKKRQTFKDHPEVLASRTKIIHEANQVIGEDGLTGYERTAKGRAKTLLEKHGRADYANWGKTKQTWKDNPEKGILQGKKLQAYWNSLTKEEKHQKMYLRNEVCIKRYGVPSWKLAYMSSNGRRSAIAEEFCESIQRFFADKLIFGSKEFNIDNKYYDLTYMETNKIIEFNGDYWHANPKAYGSLRISGRNKRTAQEIWDADAKKIKIAEDAGYRVKVIWESDYRRNQQKVIQECIEWLKQ